MAFKMNEINKKTGLFIFLILLASYTLCLLVCFPGVGMNDGLNIMYYGVSKINQYPAIYCLYVLALMKIGLHFGTLQVTIIIYSIIQMIVCAMLGAGIV